MEHLAVSSKNGVGDVVPRTRSQAQREFADIKAELDRLEQEVKTIAAELEHLKTLPLEVDALDLALVDFQRSLAESSLNLLRWDTARVHLDLGWLRVLETRWFSLIYTVCKVVFVMYLGYIVFSLLAAQL